MMPGLYIYDGSCTFHKEYHSKSEKITFLKIILRPGQKWINILVNKYISDINHIEMFYYI